MFTKQGGDYRGRCFASRSGTIVSRKVAKTQSKPVNRFNQWKCHQCRKKKGIAHTVGRIRQLQFCRSSIPFECLSIPPKLATFSDRKIIHCASTWLLPDTLQHSILSSWLTATQAGVSPTCLQLISSTHVHRLDLSHSTVHLIASVFGAQDSMPSSSAQAKIRRRSKKQTSQRARLEASCSM